MRYRFSRHRAACSMQAETKIFDDDARNVDKLDYSYLQMIHHRLVFEWTARKMRNVAMYGRRHPTVRDIRVCTF